MQDIKTSKKIIIRLIVLTIGVLCTCYTQAQIASDYLAFNNKRIGGNHYYKALLPDDSTRNDSTKLLTLRASSFLGTDATTYWTIGGNTGTNPSSNFIGTTDDVPLVFQANGTPSGSTGSYSYSNVSFGWNSGSASSGGFNGGSGWSNTAIGAQALQFNNGNGNTAVGTWAGNLITTGEQNIAIGAASLAYNKTGSYNTAIGQAALQHSTVGPNTAIGANSMTSSTTGLYNTAIGIQTLWLNQQGSYNTAIGHASQHNTQNADNNTSIGALSLNVDTTGSRNVAVGVNTLYTNTSGNDNTALGFASGYNNVIGNRITLIGANADVTANNLTNAAAIGAGATVSQSNSLILGNGANVGIGTSSPQSKLHVVGSSAASSDVNLSGFTQLWGDNALIWKQGNSNGGLRFGSASDLNVGSWSEKMRIADNGDVGIGTTNPLALLHVNGTVLIGTPVDTNVYTPSSYMLDVKGTMRANKVAVNTTGADFVFEKDYKLKPLQELEAYIKSNHHLPDIAPAGTMQKEGVDIGELQTKLLAKVEELSLYIIEQNKSLKEQNKKIEELEKKVQALQSSAKKN